MTPSTRIPGLRRLHSPGPTRVPDEVINAMARQPTDLADVRLASLIASCEVGMRRLLQTDRAEVFFFAANGHGGWQAVIANLVSAGTSILVPGTDGWAEQVEAYGGIALRTPYVEGQAIDAAAVEAALRADTRQQIAAVFVVHTDTASGTTSDLVALRRAIDAAAHPALFVVDVVASLAAALFAMDALGVNVAMGTSQKGLMRGLGPLAGRVFRIGHLGDMNEAMILGCLAGAEAAMQVQRIAHGRGGVDAAIASLATAEA